jgi:hypothetical protein
MPYLYPEILMLETFAVVTVKTPFVLSFALPVRKPQGHEKKGVS